MRALLALLLLLAAGCSTPSSGVTTSAATSATASAVAQPVVSAADSADVSAVALAPKPYASIPFLSERVAKVERDKSFALGVDFEKSEPSEAGRILLDFVENELAAEKKYVGKAKHIGGNVLAINRDAGRIAVFMGPGDKDPKEQLATKLWRVRAYLDERDGVSADAAEVTKAGDLAILFCDRGLGLSGDLVSFEGCTMWSQGVSRADGPALRAAAAAEASSLASSSPSPASAPSASTRSSAR